MNFIGQATLREGGCFHIAQYMNSHFVINFKALVFVGPMAHKVYYGTYNSFNVFNHLAPPGEYRRIWRPRESFGSDHLVYAKPAWRNEENNLGWVTTIRPSKAQECGKQQSDRMPITRKATITNKSSAGG